MSFVSGPFTFPPLNPLSVHLSGLDPSLPELVARRQRKQRNGFVAPTARPARVPEDDEDDEWTPERERTPGR